MGIIGFFLMRGDGHLLYGDDGFYMRGMGMTGSVFGMKGGGVDGFGMIAFP